MKRLLTFIVFLFAVQFGLATVHLVPGTYSTIQAALNACSTGDTVLVATGTYYENIVWPATQSILLKSESGAAVTIIDGGRITRVISINTGVDNTTIIDGFTIKNGYEDTGGGIGIAYSSPTIKNNIITQNISYETVANYGGGGGIAIGYDSSPVIVDNVFSFDSATASAGGGFLCAYNSNPIIDNNTFENNSAATGGGAIFIHDGCSATITNNQVRYNVSQMRGGGMYFQGSSSTVKFNTIEYNTAETTGGGIEFGQYSQPDISLLDSNIITNNTAHLSGGGIGMHNGQLPTISNNVISNNTADHHGGGIYCTGNSNPLITNNQITGNEADSTGGGLSCSYGSSPIIKNNRIKYNTALWPGGGGIVCAYANTNPLITQNKIIGNESGGAGGGLFCVYDSYPTIEYNVIDSNYCEYSGGGAIIYECSVLMKNNEINYNTADGSGGGLHFHVSSSTLRYNFIENNSGPLGAGICFGLNDLSLLEYNSISYNSGTGLHCEDGSTPTINYNNICENTGYGVINIDPSVTVDAQYNWWDASNGPGGFGPGDGDEVSDNVNFANWLGAPVIVPVELTSFTATCIAGEVILNWATATEVNNLGFEIERRIITNEKQREWILIGFREGHGTTTEQKEYSYIDKISGINARSLVYRLKQIDYDGNFEYSDEVFVDNLAPVDFVLEQNYPNPFNPSTTISYKIPVKSHITLKVINSLGEEVITLVNEEQVAGNYELIFNAINIASGIYFYQLKAGDFIQTKKMVLMK